MLRNSKGKIYYGMHFYPGVAEYAEPGKDPYRVFLNENTIRSMGPTFAGCPIFVDHVDDVEQNVDKLRAEVDGWVEESFFNAADGKHWVKFIICSERGEKAIKAGMKLSNAYRPTDFAQGGQWNGVSYQREITAGEYEHLAIVNNPRYEESVIMTPEQFKAHNERNEFELKRVANSKDKGDKNMGLKLWKREKIENAVDLEGTMVELPKSKKEVTLANAIELADKLTNMHGYASEDHMVKVGENEMSVKDLVKAHMSAQNEMAEMKKANEEMAGKEGEGGEVDSESSKEEMSNEEDEEEKKKAKKENEEKEKADADEKKKNAKEKADRLKNARDRVDNEVEAIVDLSDDQVARGRQRYGSL